MGQHPPVSGLVPAICDLVQRSLLVAFGGGLLLYPVPLCGHPGHAHARQTLDRHQPGLLGRQPAGSFGDCALAGAGRALFSGILPAFPFELVRAGHCRRGLVRERSAQAPTHVRCQPRLDVPLPGLRFAGADCPRIQPGPHPHLFAGRGPAFALLPDLHPDPGSGPYLCLEGAQPPLAGLAGRGQLRHLHVAHPHPLDHGEGHGCAG